MDIVDKRKGGFEVGFKNLKEGGIFEANGCFYMKGVSVLGDCVAINMHNGDITTHIPNDWLVTPVKATLTIERLS
jgi:hypothetical protein